MRLNYVMAAAVWAVGVAGLAVAQQPAVPAALTPDQIVQARQAAYDMSAVTLAEMKLAAKDGMAAKKQAYPANALGRWARALPTMFPQGTAPGSVSIPSHARPEVWSDRAGFEKAAADYAAAADKLRDIAQADDAAGFEAQLGVVDKACDACHDNFKMK